MKKKVEGAIVEAPCGHLGEVLIGGYVACFECDGAPYAPRSDLDANGVAFDEDGNGYVRAPIEPLGVPYQADWLFPDVAAGEGLDRLANAYYGIARAPGETDDDLRQRTLESLNDRQLDLFSGDALRAPRKVANGLTERVENALLDHLLRGVQHLSPRDVFAVPIDEDGLPIPGYVFGPVCFGTARDGETVNVDHVSFPNNALCAIRVAGLAIVDAMSNGNIIFDTFLDALCVVNPGDALEFEPGAISVSIRS